MKSTSIWGLGIWVGMGICLRLGFGLHAAGAAELKAESKVASVTVYADRALVTRAATVRLALGENDVVFSGLPAGLTEDSVSAGIRTGTGKIVGLELQRQFFGEPQNEKIRALQKELEDLGDKQRELNNHTEIHKKQLEFADKLQIYQIDKVSKELAIKETKVEEWSRVLGFLEKTRTEHLSAEIKTEIELRELNRKIQLKNQELNQLNSFRPTESRSVVVHLDVKQAAELGLELRYVIGGASWVPMYDARGDADKKEVELTYYGTLTQTAGRPLGLGAAGHVDAVRVVVYFSYMLESVLGRAAYPPEPRSSQLLIPAARRSTDWGDAARVSQLELKARPLRRDVSGIMGQLLMLGAVVLCPLLVAPWLWCRRERFRLNRCRVLIDGAALLVYHRQQQLLALDLRYATRQLTPAGDLVLREADAHYLALGVDPPEHGYPDSAELNAPRAVGAHQVLPAAGFQLVAPSRVGVPVPVIQSWRAVRLAKADLQRLYAAIAAVPTRPVPDAADPGSLMQALGSVGATGRRVEEQLARLVQSDRTQARPSGLLTMLHERALAEGPTGSAARRVLGAAPDPQLAVAPTS